MQRSKFLLTAATLPASQDHQKGSPRKITRRGLVDKINAGGELALTSATTGSKL
jgi:hypothetical protein